MDTPEPKDNSDLAALFDAMLDPGSLMDEVKEINRRLGRRDQTAGYNMVRAILLRLAHRHGIRTIWAG